jgi:hypothetical protein
LVDGKRPVGVQQPRQQLAISVLTRPDPQVMERILKNLWAGYQQAPLVTVQGTAALRPV